MKVYSVTRKLIFILFACVAHHCNHLDGNKVNVAVTNLIMDFMYCAIVNHQSLVHFVAVYLDVPFLSFTTCNIYSSWQEVTHLTNVL